MTAWYCPDTKLWDAACVGGDVQIGNGASVRILPRHEPDDGVHVLIEMNYYPVQLNDDNPETSIQELMVTVFYTDPGDPGGSEVWSDYTYDYPCCTAPKSLEAAEEECRELAEHYRRWATEDLDWDGRSGTPFE